MRRVSIDVPDELFDLMLRHIPWGVRQRLMVIVIENIVALAKEHGELGLAALLSGKLSLLEVMSSGNVGRSAPVHLNTAGACSDARGHRDPPKPEDPKEVQGTDSVGGTDAK